jgi:hypothetical protein
MYTIIMESTLGHVQRFQFNLHNWDSFRCVCYASKCRCIPKGRRLIAKSKVKRSHTSGPRNVGGRWSGSSWLGFLVGLLGGRDERMQGQKNGKRRGCSRGKWEAAPADDAVGLAGHLRLSAGPAKPGSLQSVRVCACSDSREYCKQH